MTLPDQTEKGQEAETQEPMPEAQPAWVDACPPSTAAGGPVTNSPVARGCALPLQKAQLEPGETVLDLGCGEGADVLAAAELVSPGGFVYGLDMDAGALAAAGELAKQCDADNAAFIEGLIEDIPLQDESIDVVISNCVINLSDERDAALTEVHRVLRPGGRMVIADIVLLDNVVSAESERLIAPVFGCASGVLSQDEYLRILAASGFRGVEVEVFQRFTLERIRSRAEKRSLVSALNALEDPGFCRSIHGAFASVYILADK